MTLKKYASNNRVIVLGGGVIGLTTGLVLRLHGYQVTIVSKHKFDKFNNIDLAQRPSELASIHAAASVIPHSVDHPMENEILSISQKFFQCLAFSAAFGVRQQRHYEIFEQRTEVPSYAGTIDDFTLLKDNGTSWLSNPNVPKRNEAKGIWGWYFNSFFAEVPTYMQSLKELFLTSGGTIVNKEIKSYNEIRSIDADIIVNCLGRWAVELFTEDKENTKIIRGHMIKVGVHEIPLDNRNQHFSYNYKPADGIYERKYKIKEGREKGKEVIEPADVYFYPRSDGWLLGGSRQEGFPDVNDAWRQKDEQIYGETIQKKGWKLPVPKPIWDLNRELILDITGIDIDDPKYLSFSYIGYRFGRNPIRIEKGNEIESDDKILLHNYGHGGSGYTLSWGSAYIILESLMRMSIQNEISKFTNSNNCKYSFLLHALSNQCLKIEQNRLNKKI